MCCDCKKNNVEMIEIELKAGNRYKNNYGYEIIIEVDNRFRLKSGGFRFLDFNVIDCMLEEINDILSIYGFKIKQPKHVYRVKPLVNILQSKEIDFYSVNGIGFIDKSFWNFQMNKYINKEIEIDPILDAPDADDAKLIYDYRYDYRLFKKEWLVRIK